MTKLGSNSITLFSKQPKIHYIKSITNFSIFTRFSWHSYRKSFKANANKWLRHVLPQANTWF